MHRRHFIGGAALAAASLALPGTAAPASPRRRVLPVPLNPGDTVGLVSPSAATDDPLDLQLAAEAMQALGFKVKLGPHLGSRRGHLAGNVRLLADERGAFRFMDRIGPVVHLQQDLVSRRDHGEV